MSETEQQVELKKAQANFIKLLNDYMQTGPLQLAPEGANIVTQKFVVTSMRSLQMQNLESLDELTRDYLLEKKSH